MLYAFDGTWNQDKEGTENDTNVLWFRRAYDGDAIYFKGVGTRLGFLGEAIGGDVPAPEQARRGVSKSADERRDLLHLLAPLPERLRSEITELWDDYEAAQSPEARLAKALDKLETILQHTQGQNPADFDYRFNLGYGRQFTAHHPVLVAMRKLLDDETERRAREAGGGR